MKSQTVSDRSEEGAAALQPHHDRRISACCRGTSAHSLCQVTHTHRSSHDSTVMEGGASVEENQTHVIWRCHFLLFLRRLNAPSHDGGVMDDPPTGDSIPAGFLPHLSASARPARLQAHTLHQSGCRNPVSQGDAFRGGRTRQHSRYLSGGVRKQNPGPSGAAQ